MPKIQILMASLIFLRNCSNYQIFNYLVGKDIQHITVATYLL